MRRRKVAALFTYAVPALVAVMLSGAGQARTAAAGLATTAPCGGWSVVPSPSPGSSQGQLTGVAAISSTDVWAVGDYYNANSALLTLVEHWDGTRWSVVPGPSVGTEPNFDGVVAIAPSNVWAVGQVYRRSGGTDVLQTLTEQWNGVQWNLVPSPDVGSSENFLNAVDRVPGTGGLWAVGFYANASSPFPTLIEHYC